VHRLRPLPRPPGPPSVARHAWGFELGGAAVERLVLRTDFDSPESLGRFQAALDRVGASAALEAAGARAGDTVRAGGREFEYRP
ncbi:MAG: Obg family GTPase CgtA, partial [Candidatus Dormibacterales bacterium]